MKTKNIFRMLLVAVALLLGANNVKADETPTTYTITLDYDNTKGSVSCQATSQGYEQIHFTVTPNEGYEVASVTVTDANGTALNVWGNYDFYLNASNVTVTVTFREVQAQTPTEYTITLDYDNTKGSVSCQATSQGYEQIHFTVTPNEGFEVASVTVTDTNSKALNVWGDYDFYLEASNVTVSVTFRDVQAQTPTEYTITLDYDNTKGSVSCQATSQGDEQIHFTVTPNEGYEVASVTVTDASGTLFAASISHEGFGPLPLVAIRITNRKIKQMRHTGLLTGI